MGERFPAGPADQPADQPAGHTDPPAEQIDPPLPQLTGDEQVIDLRDSAVAAWAQPTSAPPVASGLQGAVVPQAALGPPPPALSPTGSPPPPAGWYPQQIPWHPPAPGPPGQPVGQPSRQPLGPVTGWGPAPKRRRRLLWWSVAVGLVLVLGAVSGGVLLVRRVAHVLSADASTPAARSLAASSRSASGSIDDQRAAGVAATLAAMSGGVSRRDEAMFLSAFDRSDAALIARQREVFAGMNLLPMDSVKYSWSAGAAELPPATLHYPAGAVATAVDLAYRLRGWDPAVVDDSVPLVFAPVRGRWLVVGDQAPPSSRLGTQAFAEPWSVGRMVVVTRPHVLVAGERAHLANVQRLATRLEQLVADVHAVWPEPSWNGKVVAYAMTDKRFVGQWFGKQAASGKDDDPRGKASFVAKVTVLSATGVNQAYRAASPRLIVTPYLLGRNDAYSISLLRHELTHVATVLAGRDGSAWLSEGVAEYTGFKLGGTRVSALASFAAHGLPTATFRAMRRGTWRPTLVSDSATFYDSDAAAVEEAYTDAWLACLYVANRYGDATLRRLYDVEAQQSVDAPLETVDAVALQTVLHTDKTTFTAAVRSYGLGLSKRVR